MFFYAGTRHKRPLISHKAREHAGQRFKDFFGEKLGGLGRAAQHEARGATVGRMFNLQGHLRDLTIKEINALKELFNAQIRGSKDKELVDIYRVIYEGIEKGTIRGEGDIERHLKNWFYALSKKDEGFEKMLMGTKFASIDDAVSYHSKRAKTRFMRSFNTKSTKKRHEIFQRLTVIAKGGDPND